MPYIDNWTCPDFSETSCLGADWHTVAIAQIHSIPTFERNSSAEAFCSRKWGNVTPRSQREWIRQVFTGGRRGYTNVRYYRDNCVAQVAFFAGR
jgi:hypothetical protein